MLHRLSLDLVCIFRESLVNREFVSDLDHFVAPVLFQGAPPKFSIRLSKAVALSTNPTVR